ncbi:MAG: hypothetical protein QX198_03925 [Methylococcaceae bacterium]
MKIKLLVLLVCILISVPCVSTAEQSSEYQSLPALSEQIAAKIKTESEQTAGIIKAESEQAAAKFKTLSKQTTKLSENMAARIKSASENTAGRFKALSEQTTSRFKALSEQTTARIKALSEQTAARFKALLEQTAARIKSGSAQTSAQIEAESEQGAAQIQTESAKTAAQIQAESEHGSAQIRAESVQTAAQIQAESEHTIARLKTETEQTAKTVAWFKAWTEKWILKIGDWVFPTPSTKPVAAPSDGITSLQNQVFPPNSVPEPTRPFAVLNSLQWNTWFLEAATGTHAPSIPDNWAVNHVGQMNALDNELTKLRDKLGDNPNINPDNFPQYEEIIHRYTTRYP